MRIFPKLTGEIFGLTAADAASNRAPIVNTGVSAEVTLAPGYIDHVRLDGFFHDPYGNSLRYSIADTDNLPRGARLDQHTGVLSGYTNDIGEFSIEVTATDSRGESVTREISITVAREQRDPLDFSIIIGERGDRDKILLTEPVDSDFVYFVYGDEAVANETVNFRPAWASTHPITDGKLKPAKIGSHKITLTAETAEGTTIERDVDLDILNSDRLIGTDGNDWILGGDGDEYINGGKGDDWIQAGGGNDKIWLSHGNDTIHTGAGNDFVVDIFGDDVVLDESGNDTIHTGFGDDVITDEEGDDLIFGGAGRDRITDKEGNDGIRGDRGDDLIFDFNGHDTIFGGQDNDRIHAEGGNDHIDGGSGNDWIWTTTGNDTVHGGTDDDTIGSSSGRNELFGNRGNDRITGGDGFDTLNGGRGDDVLIDFHAGFNEFIGGFGDDQIRGSNNNGFVVLRGKPDCYRIEKEGNLTRFEVTDIDPGDGYEGVDSVHGVSVFKFQSGTISNPLDDLVLPYEAFIALHANMNADTDYHT